MTSALRKRRNGYIDLIKFIFALIVAEFHFGTGIFPGGRLAVEGFFIISSYLMMSSIERERNTECNLAPDTVKFLWKKYKGLFYYLLPSVIISFAVMSVKRGYTFVDSLKRVPLLLPEIFTLHSTGIPGDYVLGISWYLSSMFLSLAVFYPLVKKFGRNFTLIACPLIVVLGYGTLGHFYGHLAVNYQYVADSFINTGIVRAFAGTALGCIAYEASAPLKEKTPRPAWRILFTVLEAATFAYFLYCMHYHPKSSYDYISIFMIFTFLFIGINGLSYTSALWDPRWTRPLGTASTLIVLNHYAWMSLLKEKLPRGTSQTAFYIAAVTATCLVVLVLAKLLRTLVSAIARADFFKRNEDEI